MDLRRQQFSDFIANKPLYTKFEISYQEYQTTYNNNFPTFQYLTYDHVCDNCGDVKTFKMECKKDSIVNRASWEYSINYIGTCMFCNAFKIEFIINSFADLKDENKPNEGKYFLRKIGQNPSFRLKPKKEVQNYLSSDDKENYSKALMCLSQGYGIGAFSYFRRIIENEIKRITKDVSNIDLPIEEERASKLIDESSEHLPHSLRGLGQNPLKILWQQLSIGIHSLTEEQCIEKAVEINEILSFTIQKMNEEKGEVAGIKKILGKLAAT